MAAPLVTCPKCRAILDETAFNQPGLVPCPGCQAGLQVAVFPALFRTAAPVTGAERAAENESTCFYHPQKKALLPCEGCGRFLCGLCDVELNGQHLCPACIESGQKKGRLKNLENRRVLQDSLALILATLPLLLFWITLITAPMALYVAIRHWNTPTSIIRRTKVRFVLAIVLASLQIVGWVVGLLLVFRR